MDKLDVFRNFQFIKYLNELNIEAYEVEKVGLGRKFGTNCDLAVVYTKTKK